MLKSKKYAYQKGYRDLFRHITVNQFSMKNGITDFEELVDEHAPEHLHEAVHDYTTSKGKEKNAWTDETTFQKLEAVGAKYGVGVNGFLSFAFLNIYRDVSEIIHGSYYGARIYLGMQQKDLTFFKSAEDAAEYFGSHQRKLATLIVQQINISIYALIEILEQSFLSVTPLHEVRKRAMGELNSYSAEIQQ